MSEERNNPAPKSDPPHWLQVSDESWGQTEIRKRQNPTLPAPPQDPPVKERGLFWKHEYFIVAAMFVVLTILGIVIGISIDR